uniref:Uncharacterized protein n=1 Tax=Salvator merianae TaxID=96440 RepID=A0A8D0BE53_SALMN
MVIYRSLTMLLSSLGFIVILVALSTNYWQVARAPWDMVHSGLWKICPDSYVKVTRSILITTSLAIFICIFFLVFSIMPCSGNIKINYLLASISAFLAAIIVYTAESWNKNIDPKIKVCFSWSFYLGWTAVPILLLTGELTNKTRLPGRENDPGYLTSSHACSAAFTL